MKKFLEIYFAINIVLFAGFVLFLSPEYQLISTIFFAISVLAWLLMVTKKGHRKVKV